MPEVPGTLALDGIGRQGEGAPEKPMSGIWGGSAGSTMRMAS